MSHLDNTAADKKSIGFDFQDMVLVYKLLLMEDGQVVGLEVLDDIHIEHLNNLLLIQVKHSINEENITERDIDLWKTLWNWHKSISELPKDAKEIKFILYTNKGIGDQTLTTLLKDAGRNKNAIKSRMDSIFKDLKQKENEKDTTSKPNPILKYVEELVDDSKSNLDYILERFELHSNNDGILNQIDSRLLYFTIPPDRVVETRNQLLGAYDTYKYETVKSTNKVSIDYQTFRKIIGFDRIVHLACQTETDFDLYYERYKELDKTGLSFEHSTFSKQLHDIGLSQDEIIDHGIEMVVTENLLGELQKSGTFTERENERLETQATLHWKTVYNICHRKQVANKDEQHMAAFKCYEQSISKQLTSSKYTIPDGMSKGKFIKLSDTPTIGWSSDWEEQYKK